MSPAQHQPPNGRQNDAPPPDDAPSRDDLITQWIAQELTNAAPTNWRRVDLRATMSSTATDIRFTVIMSDGSAPGTELPEGIRFALQDLREEMHQEGKGTWFSLRLTIDPPGDYHANFNFDLEPVWDPPVPDSVFVEDMKAFPRDPDHIPDWLEKKIERGTQEDDQADR